MGGPVLRYRRAGADLRSFPTRRPIDFGELWLERSGFLASCRAVRLHHFAILLFRYDENNGQLASGKTRLRLAKRVSSLT
jgi:hypothetical protein